VLSCEQDASGAARSVARMHASGAPSPPDAAVPSGAIWPPVEGRAILCELAELELTPRRLPSGDWAAGLGSGWRVVSSRDATFGSLDQGRSSLIQWARLHANANGMISPNRCIVLADNGARAWRLWQIVRAESSLHDALEHAVCEPAREALIARICQVAQCLLEADEQLAHVPMALPCNLDTIGLLEGIAVYIGLMPDTATMLAHPRPRGDPHALLRSVLEPVITAELHDRRIAFEEILGRLPGAPSRAGAIVPSLAPRLRS
jgi:hypothetical protein